MKVLIVFLGLFVVNCSFMSYQGDMNTFVRQQAELKYMAEECASGAAALWDLEQYALGELRFDYQRGKDYVEKFAEYHLPGLNGGENLQVELIFEDDYTGYLQGSTPGIPSVTAIVNLECQDIFRLPFLTVTTIERKARYQVEENEIV